jgi:hypothetical protein
VLWVKGFEIFPVSLVHGFVEDAMSNSEPVFDLEILVGSSAGSDDVGEGFGDFVVLDSTFVESFTDIFLDDAFECIEVVLECLIVLTIFFVAAAKCFLVLACLRDDEGFIEWVGLRR